MSNLEDETDALRQLAQDYRSVVEELKGRGWIEAHHIPERGLITSTELAPPGSAGYIAINFDIHQTDVGDGHNTVSIQLVMKTPDDNRIKIFTAADVARGGKKVALESFRATVMDYASDLQK